MAKEETGLNKFAYNPEAIQAHEQFNLKFDRLHWKLICKNAYDLTTTPNFLLNTILEHYLVQLQLLDPDAPACDLVEVHVTLEDIRGKSNMNVLPNKVITKEEDPSITGNDDEFEDEDELNF